MRVVLTPPREVFDALPPGTVLIDVQVRAGRDVDDLGRAHFTAFWWGYHPCVGESVRAQCFYTDLAAWIERHSAEGRVVRVEPCSHPGCGKPTIEVPATEYAPARVVRWRHLVPADEALSHVGYPMSREAVR